MGYKPKASQQAGPAEYTPLKRILVVDDDVMVHQLVTAIIQVIGDVEVIAAFNGREALEKANLAPPDLIVSDVNMPDMDGLALTGHIRQHASLSETPILLLTARSDTQDKYHGFLHGADDYLVKPFDATELQFRIKALLRRSPRQGAPAAAAGEPAYLAAGPLKLDLRRYGGEVQGQALRLTASEFAILRHLIEHKDEVVSVEDLLTQALDYPGKVGNPQVIHTHVKNLRSKMREVGVEPDFLTSSRRGYMLVTESTP